MSYARRRPRRRRDRRRAGRPRHAGRRSRRDPGQHARRVDAGRPRHAVGGRHRGAHLQHELRRGVPVRARPLRLARRLLRGRRAAREDRQRPRRLPRARAPDRPHGLGARRHDARRAARARARARTSRSLPRAPRPSIPTTWPRSSTRPGTTGPPKGCMLTHANMLATIEPLPRPPGAGRRDGRLPLPAARPRAGPRDPDGRAGRRRDDRLLARRPQADRRRAGRGRARRTSPRSRASSRRSTPPSWATWRSRDGSSAPIFAWALAEGRRARARARAGKAPGALARRRHDLADRLVLSKVRGVFGDNLHLALTGAAPIGAEIIEFFDACGVLVLEGYGLTETCAASTLNTVREQRIGTVGRPLPDTRGARRGGRRAAAARAPRLRRLLPQRAGDGREPRRRLAATPATSAPSTTTGYVRITGRKKELIITSSGKNISPTNIEELLRETRWISQAVVFGDNKPYLVALLTLDADEAVKLAEHAGRRPGRSRRARLRTRRSAPSCRPRSTP